jgi:hypothetical protein
MITGNVRCGEGTTYSGIEQATGDTEENPYVDHERETEDEGDVKQDFWTEACFASRG